VNVLAIETSTDRLSLAVARGALRHASDRVVGHRHAETLFAAVAALLDAAGLRVDDLHAVVYGAGPGAFTGLRIASGAAQGLAEARGLPVIGVSCLAAIGQAAGVERALVCIDARVGEVYHAAYVRGEGGGIAEVVAPSVVAPAHAPLVPEDGWIGVGSGFGVYGDALAARYGARLAGVDATVVPTAEAMLDLALPRLAAGERGDPADAVPVYLRDRVALTVAERRERRA
jgi:tRNA threonylcarbamoyladenosine biosynthesis protein TsaB